MAITIVALHGFIQSSLHSLVSFPLTVPAEDAAQERFAETCFNLGHLGLLKLCYFTHYLLQPW